MTTYRSRMQFTPSTLAVGSLLLVYSTFTQSSLPKAPEGYTTCRNALCSYVIVSKFNVKPSFFGGDYVFADSVYASREVSGSLLFKPLEKTVAFNQRNGDEYHNGSDYNLKGTSVYFSKDTKIKMAPDGFSNPEAKSDFNIKVTPAYMDYQVAFSYKKSDKLSLRLDGNVDDLRSYIKNLKDMKVTFYGDSITYGSNASDIYAEPHQPPFVGLVAAYMTMIKVGKYHSYNAAVPGWSSDNAYYNTDGRLTKMDSDVYVLSFGMNDSNSLPPKDYAFNIDALIANIRSKNPNSRIVFLSSTLPNPEWDTPKKEYFPLYSEELSKLSHKYQHVTFIDITNAWEQILERKNIYSITGNGANHPNDFGHRVIAEALLTAFLGDDFS